MGKIEWGRLIKKISPYSIRKGLLYLRHYGPKEFFVRLGERFEPEEIPYGIWYEAYRPTDGELARQRNKRWKTSPKISVAVPVYRTPEKFLREMVESLLAQTYGNWELCMANASPGEAGLERLLEAYASQDGRIRWKNLERNLGIAENTNQALDMAEGDYVGFLDHDDLLAPNALYEVVRTVEENPDVGCLYTDEDKVDADLSEHFQPHLKPDFNLDLLRSNNYITHFFLAHRDIVDEAGGFRKGFDGAQDYDFILRCTECAGAARVAHIPEILYHWRTHKSSTADNPASKRYAYEAGRRAIQEHLGRTGTPGEVSQTKDYGFYRVIYPVRQKDLISIIIPNKDQKAALEKCLRSIEELSTYRNYEILIIENNSATEEIFAYYREIQEYEDKGQENREQGTGEYGSREHGNKRRRNIRVLSWEGDFNYAAINNYGVSQAKGEYLLFLNNDVEVITPGWLEEMLGNCQRPEVGAVGAKLYYPDHTIQHAGCIVGIGGIAGNMFVGMPGDRSGYLHKASIQQDLSVVTAACMMMKAEVFRQAGGFTEKLAVAFNDVDLCLKVRELGYLVVYDPYVELYHDESKSRGAEDSKDKVRRFQDEIEYMRSHWISILKKGDPYYNKNLSLTKWNYSLKPIEGLASAARVPNSPSS